MILHLFSQTTILFFHFFHVDSKREFQELDTRLSQSVASSQNKDENGFQRREQLRQSIEAFESDPLELARAKNIPILIAWHVKRR